MLQKYNNLQYVQFLTTSDICQSMKQFMPVYATEFDQEIHVDDLWDDVTWIHKYQTLALNLL